MYYCAPESVTLRTRRIHLQFHFDLVPCVKRQGRYVVTGWNVIAPTSATRSTLAEILQSDLPVAIGSNHDAVVVALAGVGEEIKQLPALVASPAGLQM